MKIRKCTTPETERLDRLIQNFRKDPKSTEKLTDMRETLNIDLNIKKLSYHELADMYYHSYINYTDYRGFPIKEQIQSSPDLSPFVDEENLRSSKISVITMAEINRDHRYSSLKKKPRPDIELKEDSKPKGHSDKSPSPGTCYRYTYFPKLLNELVDTPEAIRGINWPPIAFASSTGGYLHDVFKPKGIHYTKENINDAIWLATWISTYWYHESTEK